MKIPQGYDVKGENLTCRLKKSIYGLKQASRQWFAKFSSVLTQHGFQHSYHDYSLFTKGSGDTFVVLLVYVDDIIVSGPNATEIDSVKQLLKSAFKLKDLGKLKFFLGLEIAYSATGISLSQRAYALSLLHDTGFTDCRPASLPMDPNLKLSSDTGPELADSSQYRRLIGRLLYLTISRPDIAFTVNKLSQFLSKPTTTHLDALHHLLRYLKTTPGQGLFFSRAATPSLTAYTDADWGNCVDTRRSTTGFCIFFGSSLISWKSKKQATVSRSSAEAEYRALAAVSSELKWLQGLLRDFQVPCSSAMVLCDSQSAIHIASNPTFHERTKHIDIDCHFVRELVQQGVLKLIHVRSKQQLADVLTKPLPLSLFQPLLCKMGLLNIYTPS